MIIDGVLSQERDNIWQMLYNLEQTRAEFMGNCAQESGQGEMYLELQRAVQPEGDSKP